jgi:N-methylhydantoinase B
MQLITTNTGHNHPPYGVAGGMNGTLGRHWLEDHDGGEKVRELKNAAHDNVNAGEDWVAYCSGGGGYGDPLDRDPELVRDDARNRFVSLEAAREIYGVVLNTEPELYGVDEEATERLRGELRKSKRPVA